MRRSIFPGALLLLGPLTGIGGLPLGAQSHAHHPHAAHAGPADPGPHPEPRPGITAERVLPAEGFTGTRARQAYALARAIPQVLDGLFCHCDCHDRDGLRSLLSCFENDMASTCGICQSQARLAHRLHQEGRSLDEIRAAIDAEYGR